MFSSATEAAPSAGVGDVHFSRGVARAGFLRVSPIPPPRDPRGVRRGNHGARRDRGALVPQRAHDLDMGAVVMQASNLPATNAAEAAFESFVSFVRVSIVRFRFRRIRTTIFTLSLESFRPRPAPQSTDSRLDDPSSPSRASCASHASRSAHATMRHDVTRLPHGSPAKYRRLHERARRPASARRRARAPSPPSRTSPRDHRGCHPEMNRQVVRRRDGIEAFLVAFLFELDPGSLWSPRRSRGALRRYRARFSKRARRGKPRHDL